MRELGLKLDYQRTQLFSESLMVFILQICMLICIYKTVSFPYVLNPPTTFLALTRFMAGFIMQIILAKELKHGLDKMKYVVNHMWKFKNPTRAYLNGFFQATIVIVVTFLNYYLILASETVVDVILNFIALEIITQFDDFIFHIHDKGEVAKVMINDVGTTFSQLVIIETTTSTDGEPWLERGNIFENLNKFKPR